MGNGDLYYFALFSTRLLHIARVKVEQNCNSAEWTMNSKYIAHAEYDETEEEVNSELFFMFYYCEWTLPRGHDVMSCINMDKVI